MGQESGARRDRVSGEEREGSGWPDSDEESSGDARAILRLTFSAVVCVCGVWF
jgi:hypothetical protein